MCGILHLCICNLSYANSFEMRFRANLLKSKPSACVYRVLLGLGFTHVDITSYGN